MTKQVRQCHIVICVAQPQSLNPDSELLNPDTLVFYGDESGSASGGADT